MKNDVKIGAVLSYVLIVINALYGILITPFTISSLGVAEYGVYKTISSFTAAFVVLDLGLGTTMIRYIAKYRAEKREDKIGNYIAMSFVQAAVLVVVTAIVTFGGFLMLDPLYAEGLTAAEIVQAKKLYAVFGLWLCIHIAGNVMSGIIKGYNKFAISNTIRLVSIIVRAVAIVVVLPLTRNSLVLPWINVVLSILTIVFEYVYAKVKLKVKIKYTHWDNSLFKESFRYTILMFITSIVAQVNNSLGNVITGALLSSTAVTIYSVGLLVFGMFEQLSTSLSGVMLPTVINTMQDDDERLSKTQNLVVKVGRVQFALLAAALVGFIIIGKEFLVLWMGTGFDDAYIITIILMVPALFELCINVCLSILRAKNIIGFRTVVIATTTAINLLITFWATKQFGYYATALVNGLSYFIGSVVIMGIYYHKKLNINVLHIYKGIFKKIWLCLLLSGVACFGARMMFDTVILKVCGSIVAFSVVYATTLLWFGLDDSEIKLLKLNRFVKGARKNG